MVARNLSYDTGTLCAILEAKWRGNLIRVFKSYLFYPQINNVSKMTGPIGPRGFNGSQGPAGPRGAIGSPGPKGAGDFSSCQYKVVKGDFVGGRTSTGSASITEPTVRTLWLLLHSGNCCVYFSLSHNTYVL